DAVAHGLAARHHEVEIGVGRVDDDGARRLAGAVVDHLAAQIAANLAGVLVRIGVGRRGYLRARRSEQRLERVERIGGSSGGKGSGGDERDGRGRSPQRLTIFHGIPLRSCPLVDRRGAEVQKACRDLILAARWGAPARTLMIWNYSAFWPEACQPT